MNNTHIGITYAVHRPLASSENYVENLWIQDYKFEAVRLPSPRIFPV